MTKVKLKGDHMRVVNTREQDEKVLANRIKKVQSQSPYTESSLNTYRVFFGLMCYKYLAQTKIIQN